MNKLISTLLNGGDLQSGLLGLLYSIPGILIALSFHEWAHAFAAYKCGDMTARNLGRMTVNPFKHLDPVGFIMLLVAGVGWAKPVPVSFRNSKHIVRDSLIVSSAGILMNIVLVFVFAGLLALLYAVPSLYNDIAANLIVYAIYINAGLAAFNILPIPPLDGYRLVETLLIRKTGPQPFMFIERYGSIILVVVLVTGIVERVVGPLSNLLVDGALGFYNLFFS